MYARPLLLTNATHAETTSAVAPLVEFIEYVEPSDAVDIAETVVTTPKY